MDKVQGRQWAVEVLQELRDRVLALMDRNKSDVQLGLFGALTHAGVLMDEVRAGLWEPSGRVPVRSPLTTWFLVRVMRRVDHYMLYTTFRDLDPVELTKRLQEEWYPKNDYEVTVTELPSYDLEFPERGTAVLVKSGA